MSDGPSFRKFLSWRDVDAAKSGVEILESDQGARSVPVGYIAGYRFLLQAEGHLVISPGVVDVAGKMVILGDEYILEADDWQVTRLAASSYHIFVGAGPRFYVYSDAPVWNTDLHGYYHSRFNYRYLGEIITDPFTTEALLVTGTVAITEGSLHLRDDAATLVQVRITNSTSGSILYGSPGGAVFGLSAAGVTVADNLDGNGTNIYNTGTIGLRVIAGKVCVGLGAATDPMVSLQVTGSVVSRLRISTFGAPTITDSAPYIQFYHLHNTTEMAVIGFTPSADLNMEVLNKLAGNLELGTNNAVAITIDSAQNVGIGTPTPSSKFHVYDATKNVIGRLETDKVDGVAVIRVENDAQSWGFRLNTNDTFALEDETNTLAPIIVEPATPTDTLHLQATTGNAGIGTASPTVLFSVNEKAGMSPIGGHLIKLTNKTGGNTVKGQLVVVYSATAVDDAFATAGVSSANVVGIVYEAGIADGSEAWIITGGIADVLMDGGGSARGDRIISSATAGSADVWNVGGAVATHFQEIGHCTETRSGAGLARVVLHFN